MKAGKGYIKVRDSINKLIRKYGYESVVKVFWNEHITADKYKLEYEE